MSSSWGSSLKIAIFGESHGAAIGVNIDGLPAGIALDTEQIQAFMNRRAPGKNAYSTPRKEVDIPKILSGVKDGKTTGAPLCAIIENADTRSGDYTQMQTLARPGHADYTGFVRYNGQNDVRGGGHFSARLTAPLVFAGAVANAALQACGIFVGAHIAMIHGIYDAAFDPVTVQKKALEAVLAKEFPVIDDEKGVAMQSDIEAARKSGDSVGGVVACYAIGMPVGIGSPMFDGLENKIASIVFGIPAVKGLEFGAGFAAADLYGSENNDAYYTQSSQILTRTNKHGGILGGISSGMPITLRVAFKPTPTIAKPQQTVDYRTKEPATIQAAGRHDPCVVPRAVPCVEAAVAIALLDAMLAQGLHL